MAADTAQEAQGWNHSNGESSLDDPLLDCLVIVTRMEGRTLSPEALRAGLPLEEGRLTPALFVHAAERAGLSARVVRRPLAEISPLVLPAVLLLKGRQACILTGLDSARDNASVIQTESGTGEIDIPLQQLARDYSGYTIFTRPRHQFDKRAPSLLKVPSRHWFWGTLFNSWRIYRDVLVASLLINLFALATPLFIMNVYDRVVPNNALETLWVLAVGVALVYCFDLLMRMLRGYFIDVAGKKSDVLLSSAIFERIMGIRMEARPPSVGAFANNLREFESIREFITSATITGLVDLPFIVIFLLVIGYLSGPLVVVPAVCIPLVILYALIIQGPLRKAVESTFRASAQKGAMLVESLTGLETIRHLGAESALQRKWEQLTGHIAQWGVRSRLISSSAVNLALFFQQFAQVAVVVWGVHLITAGSLSTGGLIAAVILTGRAMAPVSQVANLSVRYLQARTALESLDRVMSLPVERDQERVFLSRADLRGDLDFEHVSFSYPGEEHEVLSDVSFRLRQGERVAVIGRVGSGKSTLQKLIQGLYAPSAGAVRLGGTDIRQIDPADLRTVIGYVPQDLFLFYGSVRENIVLGAPHTADAEVLRAAEIAGVSEFIAHHPRGFDMQVGERGEHLSGGQRQSVALARALLGNPRFLLMDEPSNSMDNATEELLKRKLAADIDGRTILLVTHRASLLDLVDRLIVLESGRIVADGPKQEVLEALRQGRLRGVGGSAK